VIHREGAGQADLRLGWYGIDRHDPNWADRQVALAIMGGVFNSRLNTVLREERGYTYGVSMNAQPFRAGGTIEIATSTQTSTAKDLIEETLEIIAVKEGFSAEETAAAIGYLTLSAPLSLDTAEAVTAQGATLAAARLDLDYVTSALAALSKVTPSSAMEAYQRLVDPASATTVVVADTSELTNY
jgi:predicted Zn-dependent peptidase